MAFAEIGPRGDAGDGHLPPIPLHPFPVDCEAIIVHQDRRDTAGSIKGMRGIQGVNPMLDRHFFSGNGDRHIILTRAIQGQQRALGGDREVAGRLDQGEAFRSTLA